MGHPLQSTASRRGRSLGLPTEGRLRWCAACAIAHPGAANIGAKKCEDCALKVPNFGLPAEGKKRWCAGCAKVHKGTVDLSNAVRALPGCLSALSVSHRKSVLYGAFVLVCRELNGPKRRFPARVEPKEMRGMPADASKLRAAGGDKPRRCSHFHAPLCSYYIENH
jgi:hypothetical protein